MVVQALGQDLQARLSSVFSVLEQHNPHVSQPEWSLSREAVRIAGREDGDSDSEDEADHEERVEVRS
jgi:hypothetical protein